MTSQVNQVPDVTTLAAGNYDSTIILNNIFGLLQKALTSVQDVAAVQAQRLQFYSNWQNYYANLMTEVPNPGLQNSGNTAAGAQQTESQFNTTLITMLQNRQSIVSDATKAMQTVVNQSNDAATSQANLGSSLLQELTTLLPIVMGQS
jgi:hypothetical protein